MTTLTESFPLSLTVAVLVILLMILLICVIATAGDKRHAAHVQLLRDATPSHHQGREADFDKHGRTWP